MMMMMGNVLNVDDDDHFHNFDLGWLYSTIFVEMILEFHVDVSSESCWTLLLFQWKWKGEVDGIVTFSFIDMKKLINFVVYKEKRFD